MNLQLSENVAGTLRIACEIARDRFDEYARELANRRVADQFALQADHMRDVIALIDEAA